MAKLVLIRHGESIWNKENRFTGWMDIPLSEKGKNEAKKAGKALKGCVFDEIFVSHLTRAIDTMHIILQTMDEKRTQTIYHVDDPEILKRENSSQKNYNELRITQSKELAERYYGKLQGLNKDECRKKYGEEQVHIWRRSYDVRPPGGESLKDTLNRALPFYNKKILPNLKKGNTLLIVAHGNSLRAIIKHLEKISDKKIPEYELATGVPIVYEFNKKMKITKKTVLK